MSILEVAEDSGVGGVAADIGSKEGLGQFMTPASVATFMADLFGDLPPAVRLLDAGAGRGSLTAAFVREACSRAEPPKAITATAFEVDAALHPGSCRATMQRCASLCAAMAALPMKSATGPAASKTRPPTVAPSVMANWITAT